MHARLTTAQGRPGEIDAVRRLWEDEILPAARQQPGSKGAVVIGDPTTGKTYSISVWESAEAERASMNSDFMRTVLAKAAALVVSPPVQEAYEVIVYDRGPSGS